uniref:T-cell surface glycoprotein CD3 gamma/delta n=1 Tax=Lutjanus sanguineus TaxID=264213 RepID=A0A0A7CDW4_9TELE|nr:T-cell surface glycoprotein CD3 gamma/delta [Lutjanus sanguineus]
MKCLTVLPACLLLLWTLTASVSCEGAGSQSKPMMVAKTISDAIVLSCGKDYKFTGKDVQDDGSLKLEYKDEKTGEYTCVKTVEDGDTTDELKVYVKFRSCDNCVQLDTSSIVGLAVGNVVATTVIGVAVYLIASQTRIGPVTSHKSSDRQRLVQNEVSNRSANEHYQVLKHKGQRDTYDVLTNRR